MTYLLVSISVLGLLIAVTGFVAFWLFDDITDVFDDLNDAYLQAVIDRSLAEQLLVLYRFHLQDRADDINRRIRDIDAKRIARLEAWKADLEVEGYSAALLEKLNDEAEAGEDS